MTYQSPAVRYQGPLGDVLRRLVPAPPTTHDYGDLRVDRLVQFINTQSGTTGCHLGSACRELRLDISSDYAGKLFRRQTGLGIREYAQLKRMRIAADRLNHTNL